MIINFTEFNDRASNNYDYGSYNDDIFSCVNLCDAYFN